MKNPHVFKDENPNDGFESLKMLLEVSVYFGDVNFRNGTLILNPEKPGLIVTKTNSESGYSYSKTILIPVTRAQNHFQVRAPSRS